MKLCSVVLFAGLAALVCADEEHGKGKGNWGAITDLLKECKEKTGATAEDMKSLKTKEPTAKGKCVLDCVCKTKKILNADGSFNEAETAKLIAELPEKMQKRANKVVEECKSEAKAGLGECESGYKFVMCIQKKMGHGKGKELTEMKKQCMKDNGVDEDTMKSNKDKVNPPTNVKCVTDCMYRKMNIIKADGSFNQTTADARIAKMSEKTQEKMKKAMDECKTVATAGSAKCESGYEYAKCMQAKTRKHKKEKKEKKEKKDSDDEA